MGRGEAALDVVRYHIDCEVDLVHAPVFDLALTHDAFRSVSLHGPLGCE